MVEIIKYITGYVRIRVTGFSPERFMNLCSNRGILLWNIRKDAEAYYMCISIQGFYQIRPLVKKTGTKAVIVRRCGLPFLMPVLWKRKMFLLGLLFATVFWFWTSRYIWAVEVEGNFTVTRDVLMDYMEEAQVHVGMKKKELELEELEKGIRREFEQITWISAKIQGTKLVIQLKENDLWEAEGEQKEKEDQPADLVAEADGKLISILVRAGVPQVSTGQEIKKGEVLVSGSIPVYQEDGTVLKYRLCRADADVVLEHTRVYRIPLKACYEEKAYTGRESRHSYIRYQDKGWLLPGKKQKFLSSDSVRKEKQLQLLPDLYLPVYFGQICAREYYMEERKYTKEEAKNILQEKYQKILDEFIKKRVQIIAKDVKIETNDSGFVLQAEFVLQEAAGVLQTIQEQPLQTEEEGEAEEAETQE